MASRSFSPSSFRFPFRFLLTALALLACAASSIACSSHQDNVCQDTGDCANAGSSDWIARCEAEAKDLQEEASSTGCGGAFDAYFACADSNYSCQGATALFPGCADRLSALDACLAAATAGTACARLKTAEATCTTGGTDAGTGAGPPPACTTARDCQAECYLANVAEVCAPQIDELPNVSTCAGSCPP